MEEEIDERVARMRSRFEFLEKASEILASSLDFKTTLSNVAHLAVPHIGDWCAVDLCGGDYCDDINNVQRLTVVHIDPAKIEFAYDIERKYPSDPDIDAGLPRVLRTGQPEFYPSIPKDMLMATAVDEEHLKLIMELGLVAAMIVPLKSRDRILGAISFVSAESGRLYDHEDLSLAEDLARRAATAIDNANLFDQLQKAERALREQLDITNTMMASLGEGVYALDRSGNVTYMNTAAERMLGWTQRELVGRNMHDVVHGSHPGIDHARAQDCPVMSVVSTGQPYRNPDDIFMRKDGTPMPVEYTSSPIVTSGRITGVILAFHDISDRKRQEEELRAQREWLQVALSSIGDAVIATDTFGAITFINPIAEELTGWKMADAEGCELIEIFKVIDEQTGEPGPNPVAQVLETRGVVGQASNILLVSSHGREIPIDDSAAPIRDAAGNMIGVILVFHDITDRKRAEDALRRSNQRITRILESIGDAFIALDRDWRFTYVNAKAAQIFSRLKENSGDLIGKVLWAEFPDLIWTDLYDPFHQAVREQRPVAFETHYPEAGGWFGFHAYPSFDSLSVFIQDITDRKQIEGERTRLLGEAQDSERRFRELVNTLAGIFWEADAHTLAFSFVSDRAYDILGYPVERWLNEPDFWSRIIFEEDREKVLQTVHEATEAGLDHDFLYRAIAADGRIVRMRDIVYVVRDEQGRPDRLRGVMVEVPSQEPAAGNEGAEEPAPGESSPSAGGAAEG